MNMRPLPPRKPFENYKWRWATFQPTESLNSPPIFLGALRVFQRFRDLPPSDQRVLDALAVVQDETDSPVDLVRSSERNLIRNSGQYWKALGLLEESHGRIRLSQVGNDVAIGKISQLEFATSVVVNLELPNRFIEDPIEWDSASLRIKPLLLILETMATLKRKHGPESAYLTSEELTKLVIPLAGDRFYPEDCSRLIDKFRRGVLDVSTWPNCAPISNDRRMAREFLLFLMHYGFCKIQRSPRDSRSERFYLSTLEEPDLLHLHEISDNRVDLQGKRSLIRESHIPEIIQRRRLTVEVLERPYQTDFRKNVLSAFKNRCVITGVNMDCVLEAAHIKDVRYNGSDRIENGLCLRADVHKLFDSNHLRIKSDGAILISQAASLANNYAELPRQIELPPFIRREFLDWRLKYT